MLGLLLSASAQALSTIPLTPPDTQGGKPLLAALRDRASSKAFADQPISQENLSSLLWAAYGINRPDTGKRTAASAFNCQDIDIYLVTAAGTWLYRARPHQLDPVSTQDHRALAATQDYARVGALQLVYVSDYRKMEDRFNAKKPVYAAFHAGAISQNVYLYCASAGLATVVRDSVDRTALKKALELDEDQHIVMAQTVGHFQP
jgi:SagB-type dehydrogenase family enzyme